MLIVVNSYVTFVSCIMLVTTRVEQYICIVVDVFRHLVYKDVHHSHEAMAEEVWTTGISRSETKHRPDTTFLYQEDVM